MTVWVALLRAVNLGARNKVPMATLRAELEAAGLPGAKTHLQSGNVMVRSDLDVGPLIHQVLRTRFELNEPVMVRSQARLAEIIEANPFPAAATSRPTFLRVVFLADHPPAARAKALEEHDDIRVQDREVYIDYRDRVHGNPLNAAMVSRRLGLHGTERNWATITKLAEIAALL
ncbi:hypothetical protein Ade02nite_04910 [Paractinoplanes deccanensis]|uniref:DUF1697 domain-containing protein n=1 Tax=Paractinoplanes deccanensis TaxID=113561 RepID=A0ABQ3XW02_9ACTN|nr:DUF1697 domain-containing protein [Actinoplanes deccanensis]GID71850.1 hypothetical protein Ade02nite_04910 [Actinoplanes deccanensis]